MADDVSGDLVVSPRLRIPAGELAWRFSRSSGPGGQSVNTSDSRAELSYDIERSPSLPVWLRDRMIERLGDRLVDGTITIVSSEHRSQLQNREAARARLAALLRDAAAPPAPPRRPTKPSRGAREARLADKRRRSRLKDTRRGTPDE